MQTTEERGGALRPERQETPTETLMRAMEDFGDEEPRSVACLWTTKSGEIRMMTNDLPKTEALGLIEGVRVLVKRAIKKGL